MQSKREEPDLDGIRWQAELSLRAFGVVLRLRTNKKELLSQLIKHLPPGWVRSTARRGVVFSLIERPRSTDRYLLYLNDKRIGRAKTMSRLLTDFESDVQLFVAEMSPRRVFVHAGVVGWGGGAVIIPGRSFSGKTTLVREMLRAGATYYSDEYAVLDERGRVHPYARPLAVRKGGETIRVRPEAAGVKVGDKPLPVRLILICRYREGGKWRPRTLSNGAGALEVLNNTVPARRRPQKVVEVIGRVVSGARIIKTTRGEGRDTVEKILRLMD